MWYPFFDILVKANVVNTQTFRVRLQITAGQGTMSSQIGYSPAKSLLIQRNLNS